MSLGEAAHDREYISDSISGGFSDVDELLLPQATAARQDGDVGRSSPTKRRRLNEVSSDHIVIEDTDDENEKADESKLTPSGRIGSEATYASGSKYGDHTSDEPSSTLRLNDGFVDDEAEEADEGEEEEEEGGEEEGDEEEDGYEKYDEYDEDDTRPKTTKTKKSRLKVHVPKHQTCHEPTYVTQLTQPYSSPSVIRPPRWKKPTPDGKQKAITDFLSQSARKRKLENERECRAEEKPKVEEVESNDFSIVDSDPELLAAIRASLGDGSLQKSSQHKKSSRGQTPQKPDEQAFKIGNEPEEVTDLLDDDDPELLAAIKASLENGEPAPSSPTKMPRERNRPNATDIVLASDTHQDGDNDPELLAALQSSLDSYNGAENISHNVSPEQQLDHLDGAFLETTVPDDQNDQVTPQKPLDAPSYDTDDIPEEAFESSPLSPAKTPATPSRLNTVLSPSKHKPVIPSSPLRHEINIHEQPTHHKLNEDAMKTWVYPMNLGTKRDYQFNITRKGLFDNMLVALPTGLGKTFIAATIMLNWFRWTVDAQIVFVAPTKPLVSQQVNACFNVAGIARSATTMLTGNTASVIRAEEWQQKRVFFMTPQTLVNDLKSGIADPKRIVLLVVDEAHRATGGYAYVEAVQFLLRFNKSFRVLALTATPGSTVEAVQQIIDGLNISKVEIRTEQSLDIRQFIHSRRVQLETFENSREMTTCMELFSDALRPVVEKLNIHNAYWGRDPMTLTPYGLTQARVKWMNTAGRNSNQGIKAMINAIFTVLASLAHSIDLLKYHGIRSFYRGLQAFQEPLLTAKSGGGGKYRRMINDNKSFKKLMDKLKDWSRNEEFTGHPKLDHLKSVVGDHFAAHDTDPNTRIMIFAQFRHSAENIVQVLGTRQPTIRPQLFIGQASAKDSEGMSQKQQLAIIEKFKGGVYNTIVATSIGEEGLDIGEVDLIVCYDSSASPVRMLQRMGRTGRKRKGRIVLLLMRGKEEDNYTKAKDNYEQMQKIIASGTRFEFHDDKSPRILPWNVRPVVDERTVDIPEENSQQDNDDLEPKRKPTRGSKKPPKKFHMPDDVQTGFQMASGLDGQSKIKGFLKQKPAKHAKPPVVETEEVPADSEVVLSKEEESELEGRFCNVGSTSPQYICQPRYDVFPASQRQHRPIGNVGHGTLTRRMVRTFRTMSSMTPHCKYTFKRNLHPDDIFTVHDPPSTPEMKPRKDIHDDDEESVIALEDDNHGHAKNAGIDSSQASLPSADSIINNLLSKSGKKRVKHLSPIQEEKRSEPDIMSSQDFDDAYGID